MKQIIKILFLYLDPHVPFVPELSTDLVVSMDNMDNYGFNIPCRVSHWDSYVILRKVPSGEAMHALYNSKEGFFSNNLSPGQYQCETTVNGQIFRSSIYTVMSNGKSRQV